MKEIWKQVPLDQFNKFYEISNLGNVRPTQRRPGNTRRILANLKPKLMHDGYLFIRLNANEGQKYFNLHRLIAKTFIPNPMNLPQVNHKNYNKIDNRVSNLEWVTPSFNVKHSFKKERKKPIRRLAILRENGLIPKDFDFLKGKDRRILYRSAYKKAIKKGII